MCLTRGGQQRLDAESETLIPTIAFHPTQDPISSSDLCHAIGANENATAAVAFAQNQRDEVRLMDVAGALAAEPGMKQQTYLQTAMQVRRLTPVECERLQGFQDNYTAIPWRKKPATECPDGPRYKALGNSWAVPVARWIGDRINKVSKIIDHTKK
jgi:DNA (cytosine-5)-methyltransferase 1